MSNDLLTFIASMVLARIGKGPAPTNWHLLAYALLAGAVAGLLIWVVCKIADYAKSRFIRPRPLPPEAAPPKIQLRVSDFLMGSALYGMCLFAASNMIGPSATPEALLPWALYLLVMFTLALVATGDLCSGGESQHQRCAFFCVVMLSFTLLLPFGLSAWWIWRRWKRVQRALKNLERTTFHE